MLKIVHLVTGTAALLLSFVPSLQSEAVPYLQHADALYLVFEIQESSILANTAWEIGSIEKPEITTLDRALIRYSKYQDPPGYKHA